LPRMRSWALFTSALVIGNVIAMVACSSDAPTKSPKAINKDAGNVGDDTSDDSGPVDPPPPEGGPPSGRVYAHTTDTLYVYEPFSRKLTEVGKFNCLQPGEAVIDIAVDRTNEMYATTFLRFLHVDATSGACTERGNDSVLMDYPNSLSFVPVGTVDPTVETLVGYASPDSINSDVYVRIDVATGKMTTVGDLNPPGALTQYSSTGDLISLLRDGNKTYLTVRDNAVDSGIATDKLAEINPATGQIKRIIGDTKQNHTFGLGYWAGKAYGFSEDGRVNEIDINTGTSTVLLTHMVGGAAVPWYGAGVTTNAPISP
jgi:hypothetical protein